MVLSEFIQSERMRVGDSNPILFNSTKTPAFMRRERSCRMTSQPANASHFHKWEALALPIYENSVRLINVADPGAGSRDVGQGRYDPQSFAW